MWDWSFTVEILPKLLKSLQITLSATFVAFILSCVLGLLIAIIKRSSFKPLVWFVGGIVEFVRSTPLLAQVFFVFYVFPKYGLDLSPFLAGVLTLGVHYSTYLSEVYRSGIEAVPKGQWEAASVLNFSRLRIWLTIIIPQAIPPIIPIMGNYLIALLKDTPLLSAITLIELLGTAKIIGADFFRYLEPITMAGLIFLVLSYLFSLLVQQLSTRLNQHL
ncbi:ectoine/hydroxyectoine ABC transporter permease subunit EhuD [Desulfosporosinus sp.]|uniref:ectoine/hydroxyectoine ABC transporter permease subunit EhuD n=1 Tax=Desulfosporosinus sp. TaxID=157907 RepID=UPI002316818D|nr:ectoine/hydroxyectoine ABC transporter permease subunit EhuD [Desulfosporosinus sp.]MCO5388463.1 ectoine/hydroxyectoine ABC transporter permease subunit EhuD [Desulfosporosinus sp.]MDA8220942.1 ectoine/hydroxyectoine ABC transporter permease subunit EhuD [Desulfitobacterium hafniense]